MGERKSGILLHPTSLPGRFAVGDVGPGARRFLAWLERAGQRLWQVLPLSPTGYGDSPYQALSAFAGHPLLVSPEDLVEEGWLAPRDLEDAPPGDSASVPYERVIPWKSRLLRLAAERFERSAPALARAELDRFNEAEQGWLEDFALFMALKEAHGGAAWTDWDPALARREPRALAEARRRHAPDLRAHRFAQFAFFRQWDRLRRACREKGIAVMGDVPIYVAHDSAEVWARRELFRLDAEGQPTAVAGVPPDYFSATGQLWGNPLYDWPAHERAGYGFWIERTRAVLRLVDRIRLDHFRGFEGYWEVPAGETTALRGRWSPGPGARLFEALEQVLGKLPLVAENLGVITPEVEALRRRFGYPGMAILQFAFGDDPQAETFKPHNYERDLVAYTGTHDNDTAVGWWSSTGEGDTRTPEQVERERASARRYLHAGADGAEIHWLLIRWLLASVADTAVVPLQDVLGLGSEARMNRPSTAEGNWRWRCREDQLGDGAARRLGELAETYGRR